MSRHKEMKWIIAVIIILLPFLSGCSSRPSDSAGRSVLENAYKNIVKISSFKKTNAQEGNAFGVSVYEMEYEATVEYISNACEIGFGRAIEGGLGGVSPISDKPSPLECMAGRIHKKGEKETIKGKLVFEKTEKGWKGPDGQLY